MRKRLRKILPAFAIALLAALLITSCGPRDLISHVKKETKAAEASSAPELITTPTAAPTPTPTPKPPWYETAAYQDKLPERNPLFINAASYYYYYEQLNEEERQIYRAIEAVLQDPGSRGYHKRVETDLSPSGYEYQRAFSRAEEALRFDHPEYFLLSGQLTVHYYYEGSGDETLPNGKYLSMIRLGETCPSYEEKQSAFNAACEAFLAGIDRTLEAPDLALLIHDRLIDLVSYDDLLADQIISAGDAEIAPTEFDPLAEDLLSTDLSHTAYGALVENSRSDVNTAVCDGYAYALLYLWQQVGIDGCVLYGRAGDTDETASEHAWNGLLLEDAWYEVDPTWDDASMQEVYETIADGGAAIYQIAADDASFTEPIRHYMYALTTEEITNYLAGEPRLYETETEQLELLLGDSVHIRPSAEDPAWADSVALQAPIAYGELYSYENLVNQS